VGQKLKGRGSGLMNGNQLRPAMACGGGGAALVAGQRWWPGSGVLPGQCARPEEEREGARRITGATPKGRHGRGVAAQGGEAGEEAGGSRLDGGCVTQSDAWGD
jgi:hypothetical protein